MPPAAPPAPPHYHGTTRPASIMAADGGADIMPDLSHLTEDERRIIESVMHRHKIEEERESELVR